MPNKSSANKLTKELARREMGGEGPFAAQIHALKQQKMVVVTEAQHRKG